MLTDGSPPAPVGLASVWLAGFKCFREPLRFDLSPLTVLAGANSAGKSSLLQGLLLLKQTLEAPYDPGALLLDGPLVRLDDARQMLWRDLGGSPASSCEIGFDLTDRTGVTSTFTAEERGPVLERTEYRWPRDESGVQVSIPVVRGLREEQHPAIAERLALSAFTDRRSPGNDEDLKPTRNRCFLELPPPINPYNVADWPGHPLFGVIHLPGLRGNPERAYKVAGAPAGDRFPGSFVHYVATLVVTWQESNDPRLAEVSRALSALHLTTHVQASRRAHTEVELRVGRNLVGNADDPAHQVNIADVGIGVSQVLPVVVALVAAAPGQLVHIEQPELHLHPRAQVALAGELVRAAHRGVRLVVETHSSVLLTALQLAIAEGLASPDLVGLHWFTRDAAGATQITTAELDAAGTYGDWPVDFADVELNTARRLIEASFRKQST